MQLCVQASIESLSVSSVGTTISNGLWGLDRIDQQSRKRDYMYHYSSIGTGVHVYTVDTASHRCLCATNSAIAHTTSSHMHVRAIVAGNHSGGDIFPVEVSVLVTVESPVMCM